MYIVKEIIEPDFGCEGLPEGTELCCEVVLTDEDGKNSVTVKVRDAELYEKDIVEGSVVEIENGTLRKVLKY